MASSQLSHLPLASTHRPSIATLFIIISASLVPFLALSSPELIQSTFSNIAHTLWDSLLGIVTSSPFYFFLLNFLIVALVCSSGVLDPSSKRHDSAELQDGDPPQSDFYSASHIIHERLALDEFYGSQAASPSYLRLIERSNVHIAREAHDDNGTATPATSTLLQHSAFTDMDASVAMMFSPSTAHSTNSLNNIKLDAIEGSITTDALAVSHASLVSVKGHMADLQDERTFHGKAVQVCDEDHRDVREDAGDVVDNCNNHRDADGRRGDEHSGVEDADNDVNGKHKCVDDDNDVDAFQESDASTGRSYAPMVQTEQTHRMKGGGADEQVNVGDEKESKWDEDGGADASDPNNETAGERQGMKGKVEIKMDIAQHETEEEVQMMSTEELNERASAFISAFRRKLISTAIVDD